jgi:hypothetical protein
MVAALLRAELAATQWFMLAMWFRVELVMISGDGKHRSFALKQMKKSQIVETRQQQHIMSEKVCQSF